MQEDTKVISQRMKLKPDLIVTEPLAGQSGPGDGVLAFLDVLFGCAALIVEADDPVWVLPVLQGFSE